MSGSYNHLDEPLAQAILAHLQKITKDYNLTLNKIERGSIVLYLEGSPEGLETLKSLFEDGKLENIFGMAVLNVQELIRESSEERKEPSYYHFERENGLVVSIFVMRRQKVIREIDPMSKEGRKILGYDEEGTSSASIAF